MKIIAWGDLFIHFIFLGGHVLNDWMQKTVSHLVMDGLTFTIKVQM